MLLRKDGVLDIDLLVHMRIVLYFPFMQKVSLFDWNISVLVQRKCNLYHQTCSHLTKSTSGKVSSGQVELEDEINDEACELVSGTELTLGEGEDNIRAFLFKAVKNNNGAGVLLLSDIYGFEDSSTRDFAYRVACSGYKYVSSL